MNHTSGVTHAIVSRLGISHSKIKGQIYQKLSKVLGI